MTEPESAEPVEPRLPPIHHVKEPQMQHTSTKIRWYAALGYKPAEIQKRLGVLYQQVRNVMTTVPKRAAREDLPPLVIELLAIDDDLEAMDKHHLEAQMAAQRIEDRKNRARAVATRGRRTREAHALADKEEEVDEITEQ